MKGGEEGGEDKICKPQKEDVRTVTPSIIVRRGGRVSNIVKTLEAGAKRQNKVILYFLKPGVRLDSGHPLATSKLCDSGTKRRNYESENACDGVSTQTSEGTSSKGLFKYRVIIFGQGCRIIFLSDTLVSE